MIFDITLRREAIAKAQSEFLSFRNKERDLAFRQMLDALIEDYQFELMHASKDGIEKKQGAVLQLIQMRNFIDDPIKHQNLKI